ncbi:glucose 1-dehydrogenase [uncultured Sneathiella sp.]|jgi:2-hydroxycyclohexanecarboxyl-CoA dehydrogenase|uniref:glucose 1-dehydrogenase n=1 Tax=uncultured Sneathiella sp. TaxID=879315 RepID=UPI0030DCB3E0|tara:strand:+ start:3064 stop:3825 length:762 start_codon:yes stop_codon:yes gene_type:complete
MRGLTGKHVIVTGSGSGIGREIALRFAEEGAKVALFDVNSDGVSETRRLIDEAGGQGAAYVVDITDREAVDTAVQEVEEAGPVDVLVNNAGWDKMANFLDTDADLWKKIIDINLYGPLYMHHAVLPGMVKNGGGRVINISSDAGRVGSSGEAVYSACKGGIISFTKTVARELARKGIQLNAVCPGPTDTPLFAEVASGAGAEKIAEGLKKAIPMKRLAQPSDFPGIVCFLASDDAGFITGQTISVSGGLTMHG